MPTHPIMARTKKANSNETNKAIIIKNNDLGIDNNKSTNDRISELESIIYNKNVIIDSLLLQIKELSKDRKDFNAIDQFDLTTTKQTKEVEKEVFNNVKQSAGETLPPFLPNPKKVKVDLSPVKKVVVEKQNKAKRCGTKATSEELNAILTENRENLVENRKFEELGISNISDEIADCFKPLKNKMEFKENFTVEMFIDYAASSFEFRLDNRKKHNVKNPMKMYIMVNLDKIIYFIVKNVNNLPLNKVCGTLFYINNEIEQKHKLIIAIDLLLNVIERSKLLFMISALFNNIFNDQIGNDDIFRTICSILHKQYDLEMELYKDNEEIVKYLLTIKTNFSIFTGSVDLFDLLDEFLDINVESGIIDYNRSKIENSFDVRAWCVRLLCHVLDWDYTYNTVIIEKLNFTTNAFHTLCGIYLGIDAFNKFKDEKGVKALFTEFVFKMEGISENAQLLYSFLKEINEEKAEEYLEFNRLKLGFEKVFQLNKLRLF